MANIKIILEPSDRLYDRDYTRAEEAARQVNYLTQPDALENLSPDYAKAILKAAGGSAWRVEPAKLFEARGEAERAALEIAKRTLVVNADRRDEKMVARLNRTPGIVEAHFA